MLQHNTQPTPCAADVFRVGRRRSLNPPPCWGRVQTNVNKQYIEKPVFSAIIQTFKDNAPQPQQLVTRLRAVPLPKEIIVNDDSQGARRDIWVPLLDGANEFYISSPNLHEVRAYNRLAQFARGEYLVFVQGDCCLPAKPFWMTDATRIFKALPQLAMLSARVGFSDILDWTMDKYFRNNRTWGASPYLPLDHVLHAPPSNTTTAKEGPLPFMFAPGVDNGPLLYRRDALLRVGGFDESYSCAAGHLSGHYDFEVSLRFWTKGYQVGVFYGFATNSAGRDAKPRKTMSTPAKKNERHKNEVWNGKRIARLWAAHNATIASRLEASRLQHLVALPPEQREATRLEHEKRIGKLSKLGCYAGIVKRKTPLPS